MIKQTEAHAPEPKHVPAALLDDGQDKMRLPGPLTETERIARKTRWARAPGTIERFAKGVRRRARRLNRLFMPLVLIPTGLATVYYGLIAHDIYVSESQFVVRTQQHPAGSGLGALFQGTALGQTGDSDISSVQEFLLSRDALQRLDQRFHLKQSFGGPGLDRLSRFAALDGDDSFEALLLYYRKRVVQTDLDTTSSILTLTVRAFTDQQASGINEALLKMSEEFVNGMNERARRDLVSFATADLQSAEQAAKQAVLSLASFRNKSSVFDPEKQSGLQLQEIGKLEEERIATQNQIADVRGVAKDNPQIAVLEERVKVLQSQIDAETGKVAGDVHSLSTKSAAYEAALLERDFAEKRLELALTSLEQARESANRQQVYLERIEQPNRPDVAIEPRRIRNVMATLLLSLIVWGVVSLLAASVKEHAD
jgi:capsular polysaccharide transport system permease protein